MIEIMNCNPIWVGVAIRSATGGRMRCISEIAKPAIIRGTISEDTSAVLSGLIIEILLKYQIVTGSVIKNTTHDSRNTSLSGRIGDSNRDAMFPQVIMPIVAHTES